MTETPPTQLSPARVNAKAIFMAGIVGWTVGLVALVVLRLVATPTPNLYLAICVAGIVLGWLGYAWAHHRRLIDDSGMSEQP